MKPFVLLAAASLLLATPSVEAADRSNRSNTSAGNQRQGPISRMLELERRKNEWLRQTFLRR